MNTAHRIADNFRSVISYWTPTPTVSQFIDRGTLTPQEFVDAGDQLAFKFPTWKCSRGKLQEKRILEQLTRMRPAEGRRQVSWLPRQKQYLITYGVSCRSRVRDLDRILSTSSTISCLGDNGDTLFSSPWFVPFCTATPDEPDTPSSLGTSISATHQKLCEKAESILPKDPMLSPPGVLCFSDIDEILEVEGSVGDEEEDDEDAILTDDMSETTNAPLASRQPRQRPASKTSHAQNLVGTRSYDLSVTYDKYYQTPRLWLKGYDQQGIPLTSSQIFEDILTDYVAKTVTIDPHPCTGELTVSIHPCRHAEVMKKVVDGWISNNMKPRHDLALIVLLKFISSVIPTIQYDMTLDVDGFSVSQVSNASFTGSTIPNRQV